jgi:serine protease AprX
MKNSNGYIKTCPFIQSIINSNSNNSIPVIVSLKSERAYSKSNVAALSKRIKYELPIVNGFACDMNIQQIKHFYNYEDIDFISYDSNIHSIINRASKTIGLDKTSSLPLTGKGVTVALIDTGIVIHKDLTYPSNRIVGFKDFLKNKQRPYDDNGHGTHISGLVASNGVSSKGKYKGIAPEANILSVKALDNEGNGKVSDILSSIQWVIQTKNIFNTKILNLSLGTAAQYSERFDPLVKAANKAIESGLIVVTAVGNNGPSQKSILSPSTSRHVISVGACDDRNEADGKNFKIPTFSSRGPTRDRIKKPDLLAPGVDIVSLSNTDVMGYVSLTGTSMSAPIVSGVVALMLQENPSLTHFEVKKRLIENCIRIGVSQFEEGAGVLSLNKLFNIV